MSLGLALAGFAYLVTGTFAPRQHAKRCAALGLALLVTAGWVGGYLWPFNGGT